jgi:ketosteroid isomerase-like protein
MKSPLEADEAAVAGSTTALLTAVNNSDVDGVLALWSDDGGLMPPHHSSVYGRAEIERYFTHLFEQRRFKFSFTSSHIQIAGSFAPSGLWTLLADIWNCDEPVATGH